jgi:predicted XRE-type DNA-binding protein
MCQTRLGVTQPRVNELLRGTIDKFSLDALVVMLNKAGMHVEMRVRKLPDAR